MKATHLHVGIFDVDGGFRVKRVDRAKAVKLATSGYQFCDVLFSWDIAEQLFGGGSFEDKPAVLFPETLRRWPFGGEEAVCIADFLEPYGERSARNQLLRQVRKAEGMGFSVHSAFEFEINLLAETAESLRAGNYANLRHFAPGNRTYSVETLAEQQPLFHGLEEMLGTLGISMDAFHTELGPGCIEVPLGHAEGVRGADDAALFKTFAKAHFRRHGITACFMSKLRETLSGQSGHLHVSLRHLADGRPAFADSQAPDRISDTARHFIGGLLQLMPEMLALCSQTVNAYKRMVPGMWAPTYASWGVQNRTVAVRVMNDSPGSTRIEFRVPSADNNPHAALAMSLAAGLWGIENRLDPGPPATGDCYRAPAPPGTAFPRDLGEAADWLDRSARARELFGDVFVDTFVAGRRVEHEAYSRHVSQWEIARYLEVV